MLWEVRIVNLRTAGSQPALLGYKLYDEYALAKIIGIGDASLRLVDGGHYILKLQPLAKSALLIY